MWECIKIAVQTVAIFYGTLWIIAFIYSCFKERKLIKDAVKQSNFKISTFDKLLYSFFAIVTIAAITLK